ncbi:MAG: hypothetical protein ACYCOR_21515, partial [Acidobacteriaceae bacterium]
HLTRSRETDAVRKGSGSTRSGRSRDAPRPPGRSQSIEFLDHLGLPPDFRGVAVRAGQAIELQQEIFPADDHGRTHLIAAEAAHQVVGLARLHAKEALDGRPVEERGGETGHGGSNFRDIGVPTRPGGHGESIARERRACADTQNKDVL